MRRIGVLVATGGRETGGGSWACVQAAIQQALAQGDEVGVFLMSQGVGWVEEGSLAELVAHGVEVIVCGTDAEAHGLDERGLTERGVRLGSQHDHARLLRDSDEFWSFC